MPCSSNKFFAGSCPTLAIVGLMGVGKTSLGRRLAGILGMAFVDADWEIEQAAGRNISDIFSEFGEAEFRILEEKIIAKYLRREDPLVLSTGGGAFVQPRTHALIKAHAISIWLKTDLNILAKRLARKNTRPLLEGHDPLEVLEAQARLRYPFYAEADIIVDTWTMSHPSATAKILDQIYAYLTERRKLSYDDLE